MTGVRATTTQRADPAARTEGDGSRPASSPTGGCPDRRRTSNLVMRSEVLTSN